MSNRTTDEIVAEYFRDIDRDIYPKCKAAIERQDQVGRSVYARPCGCRLFQGTVDERYKPPPPPKPDRMKGF